MKIINPFERWFSKRQQEEEIARHSGLLLDRQVPSKHKRFVPRENKPRKASFRERHLLSPEAARRRRTKNKARRKYRSRRFPGRLPHGRAVRPAARHARSTHHPRRSRQHSRRVVGTSKGGSSGSKR